MKHLFIFACLLLLFQHGVYSQQSGRNYVRTRTFLSATDTTKCLESIQYYDGLGRPSLSVQKGITPQRSNLIRLQEYEARGRAWRSWLPYATSSDYVDAATAKSSAISYYDGDTRPFSVPVYDPCPLDRVIREYGPGVALEDHPVFRSYLINTASGELSCKLYGIISSGLPYSISNYPQGELSIVKTADENGNISYVFTDKQGRKVLDRQMLGSVAHDTYYIYDNFDNLIFVLPPACQGSPNSSLYYYQYKYDTSNRCIEKTLPGCDPIKYVYDKADKLIFSQDGVQRSKGEWTFYLYDVFQRLVLQGICTNTNASSVKDSYVKTSLSRNSSTRMILPAGIGETGYSCSFQLESPTVHIANYYDDYTFLNLSGFPDKPGSSVKATGLLTGNITYSLGDYREYCTVTHYDQKGRIVKVISDNEMDGLETTTTSYTFSGKPLSVQHFHSTLSEGTHSETYRYSYDHAERLTSVTHQLDGYPAITMSKNDYDELGRLQSKTLHGRASLKTTYSYNIRNWLTGLSGTSFKESLSYYTGPGTANYNGNISSMEWVTGKNPLESYSFTYDGLNRLLSANYSCPGFWGQPVTPNYSERVVSYDKQGNILRLQRYGKNSNSFVSGSFSYPMVDDLTMSYVGNRLMKVSDSGLDPLGNDSFNYIDLHSDGSSDFSYDANGNLTKDLDKEISEISYNCLNLPSKVSFEDNGSPREISYLYDANGVKRSVKHVTPPALIVSPMASLPGGGITIGGQTKYYIYNTIYCDNVIYKSTSMSNGSWMSFLGMNLERILTEEGYITFNGTTPEYHYYLKDHLGNVRVVMNQDGSTVEQTNSYYPFGGIFASTGDDDQPYKFGGKELDRIHGLDWCDFGKRHLRNDAPRWMGMDPLCEKYYSISPYAYCGNNPIRYIDPNGMLFGDYYDSHTGEHIYNDGIDDNKIYIREVSGKTVKDTYIGLKNDIPDKTGIFKLQLSRTNDFFSSMDAKFNSEESLILGGWGNKLVKRLDFFRKEVTDDSDYDIKNKKDSPFYSENEDNYENHYAFFNGKLFRSDDFGNFNYGVAGKAFGILEILLEVGAGVNQLSKPNVTHGLPYGDDPKDRYMIKQGMDYYDTHFKK